MSPPNVANCEDTGELRERLAVLETKVDVIETQLLGMNGKITVMHEILVEGRGAGRLVKMIGAALGAIGLGGVLGHKWSAFLTWLGT